MRAKTSFWVHLIRGTKLIRGSTELNGLRLSRKKVGKKAKDVVAKIKETKRKGDEAKAKLKAHNEKTKKELEAWKASKK